MADDPRNCPWIAPKSQMILKYPLMFLRSAGVYVPRMKDGTSVFDLMEENPDKRAKWIHPRSSLPADYIDRINQGSNPKDEKNGTPVTIAESKQKGDAPTSQDGTRNRCRCLFNYLRIAYSACAILLCLGNAMRFAYILPRAFLEQRHIVFAISSTLVKTMYLHLIVSKTVMCRRHLFPLIHSFSKFESQFGLLLDARQKSRKSKIIIFALLFVQTFQNVAFVFGLVFFYEEIRELLWPFDKNTDLDIFLAFLTIGVGTDFGGCTLFGCNLVRGILTETVQDELYHLKDLLESIVARSNEDNQDVEAQFDNFVERYRALCTVFSAVGEVIKPTVAATYTYGIPLLFFICYGIISGSLSGFQMFILSYNVLTNVIIMVVSTWKMGELRLAATSVCDVVHLGCGVNAKLITKLSIFRQLIGIKSLGVKLYGFIVVERATLMMIGGTVATYGVVLIQFELGDPAVTCRSALGTNISSGLI